MAVQTSTVYQASEQIQVTATTTKSHTQHKLVIVTGGHESSLVKVIHMRVASHSQAHDPFREWPVTHRLMIISREWPVTHRLMTHFMRVASHSQTYDPFHESGQSLRLVTHFMRVNSHSLTLWPISWEWPVTHRLMTCFMRVTSHSSIYDPFHKSGLLLMDVWPISWEWPDTDWFMVHFMRCPDADWLMVHFMRCSVTQQLMTHLMKVPSHSATYDPFHESGQSLIYAPFHEYSQSSILWDCNHSLTYDMTWNFKWPMLKEWDIDTLVCCQANHIWNIKPYIATCNNIHWHC